MQKKTWKLKVLVQIGSHQYESKADQFACFKVQRWGAGLLWLQTGLRDEAQPQAGKHDATVPRPAHARARDVPLVLQNTRR